MKSIVILLVVVIFIGIIRSKIIRLNMGQFVHKFNTIAEYNTARKEKYKRPWTSYVIENKEVKFNKTEEEIEEEKERKRKLQTPLTFEITSDGTIVWKTNGTALTKTIEYSKDSGSTWTSITSNTGSSAPSISVAVGDIIQFRGNNTTYGTDTYYSTFSGSTAQFKVKGNIMSLINSTNFSELTTLSSNYTFKYLFYNCTGLTDTSELLLPATTLANYCYSAMFYGCTSLTTAPQLPATTLANACYGSMFEGCTGLTTAPSLPATTLTEGCYYMMFEGCTNLIQAPELPATTLTKDCYVSMFYGCRKLNYIKCLATDISVSACTFYWVSGVASTGTFVKAASMENWPTGTHGIPEGWTVQDAQDI